MSFCCCRLPKVTPGLTDIYDRYAVWDTRANIPVFVPRAVGGPFSPNVPKQCKRGRSA
jgi:hypothetical protein